MPELSQQVWLHSIWLDDVWYTATLETTGTATQQDTAQKNRSQLSKINNRQKQIELLKIINTYFEFKKEKVAYYE